MTENRAAASRIGYMDGLRAAAMVGVILIHVCAKAATALAADGQALGVSWQLANLLDALGRFAVPAYLMVTGGLLLGSDRALSVRETLRRRVVRIAAPLVFWTAAYLGLQAATVPGYDWKGRRPTCSTSRRKFIYGICTRCWRFICCCRCCACWCGRPPAAFCGTR